MPIPTNPSDRFWKKVIKQLSGCWEWQAAKSEHGYGVFGIGLKREGTKRNIMAHRFAFEELIGAVRPGFELDHLCRNPACVNPDHLEPVTHAENSRRGIAGEVCRARMKGKTHCPQGHPYSGDNLYVSKKGSRHCKACNALRNKELIKNGYHREYKRRWRAALKQSAV